MYNMEVVREPTGQDLTFTLASSIFLSPVKPGYISGGKSISLEDYDVNSGTIRKNL